MRKAKIMAAVLTCALSCTALVGCGGEAPAAATTQQSAGATETPATEQQLANPFTDYDTLGEACAAANIAMSVPGNICGCSNTSYQATDQGLVQVFYYEGDGKTVVGLIRKAPVAVYGEDISGDYTTYDDTKSVTVGANKVTMKLNNDRVYLATWNDGTYAYSVSNERGLSEGEVSDLVSQVQ